MAHPDLERGAHAVVLAIVLTATVACGDHHRRPPARPAEAGPVARGPRDMLGRRLERLVAAVVASGGQLAASPRRSFVAEGDHAVFEVDLAPGCHVLAALGVSAVGDLDLSLHETGGMLIREDVERDPVPSVRFCPPARTRVWVVLRSQQGGGEIVLADLAVPQDVAVNVADALGERDGDGDVVIGPTPTPARRAPPLPGPADSSLPAEQAVAQAARDLLDLGYTPAADDVSGTLERGRAAVHPLALLAGTCYAIVGAGAGSVRDLDLRLLDPNGAELARDTATDPRPRLRACATQSGPHRLEVRMYDGDGRYAVRTMMLSSLADAPASLPAPLRQRWAEVAARLRARGFAPRVPLERGDLRWTGRQIHHVDVRRGACYTIAAAAPEGDLDLAIIDQDGAVLAADTATDPTPMVSTCPDENETLEVEVKLFRARTQYVLGVWVSPPEDA